MDSLDVLLNMDAQSIINRGVCFTFMAMPFLYVAVIIMFNRLALANIVFGLLC